jgi:hypothetical protein
MIQFSLLSSVLKNDKKLKEGRLLTLAPFLSGWDPPWPWALPRPVSQVFTHGFSWKGAWTGLPDGLFLNQKSQIWVNFGREREKKRRLKDRFTLSDSCIDILCHTWCRMARHENRINPTFCVSWCTTTPHLPDCDQGDQMSLWKITQKPDFLSKFRLKLNHGIK